MTAVVHPTVVRLGAKSIFGRWRGVLLFVLPVILVGLAALVRGLAGQDLEPTQHVLYGLGLVVVVPLVSLLATSGLLAAEIDDGAISYLLAKPVSRYTIVASKLLVALLCVVAFGAVPMLIAGFVLLPSQPSVAVGFAVAALLGGSAYCAVFAWLSVLTRHAVVFGLVYLLIWEGLLGGLLDGIRWLSITRWSAEVADRIASLELVDNLPLIYALIALAVVVAGGIWLTGRELRAFNLTGDE
jgi:ABC-2 type transport system permease protein